MAFPAAAAATAAASLPWKDILAHAPKAWEAAKSLFDWDAKKPAPPPPEAAGDLGEQVRLLRESLALSVQTQDAQARVLAMLAEQLEGVTAQVQQLTQQAQVSADRVRRIFWLALVGAGAAGALLAVVALRF